VWHFSTGPKQNNMPVDFPVFKEKPVDKRDIARFEGKVQRITDRNVLDFIERLQPYNSAYPLDDPLWIIHDFDIIDKHKELVLSEPTGVRTFPLDMQSVIEAYLQEHPELNMVEVAHHFKEYGPLTPSISFRDVGGREVQAVIPSLTKWLNYTTGAMERFSQF
jgi:hypothetical protein